MSSEATTQSDIELLKAVVSRDSDAFLMLYDRYNRIAFGLAWRILNDPQRAEEAVQDAFMQVWRRAEGFDFDRGGNVRGWLLTIVHHRAIDARRRNSRHDQQSVTLDDHLELRSAADTWDDVAQRLTQTELREAVESLPVDQRRTVELAYFGGLSQREIAEREHAPLGTIKGRMRLGLNKLRTVLTSVNGDQPTSSQG